MTLAKQNFHAVVETCRIAHPFFQQAYSIGEPETLANCTFFGPQPAPVSADSVDLAVVRHEAEGLRQRPTGLSVSGIALVKDGKRTGKFRVGQIRVESGQLGWRQQALVNHSSR